MRKAKVSSDFKKTQALKGDKHGPGLAVKIMDLVFDQIAAAENDAAQTSAMPVDMLGRRIDDTIGPKLERLLQDRRRKNIVDNEAGAMFMRNRRQSPRVIDFEAGIGRRFEKQ